MEFGLGMFLSYLLIFSSSRKNERLSIKFRQGLEIYLIYTEMNGNDFKGVAKLISDFDPKSHFKFWQDENKWFGSFRITWVCFQFKIISSLALREEYIL
jgi:hypothetical protein